MNICAGGNQEILDLGVGYAVQTYVSGHCGIPL
jgi:hypothetical protein